MPDAGRAGTFTYLEALEDHCFVQVSLIQLGNFRTGALARGLMASTQHKDGVWETLDREGLLPPVAYALSGLVNHHEVATIGAGHLLVRDESGYIPWSELNERSEELGGNGLYPLYNHWQYLTLASIELHLTPDAPLPQLANGLDSYRNAIRRAAEANLDSDRLRELADDHRRGELELTRVHSFLMPVIRQGSYTGTHSPDFGSADGIDWTFEQQAQFNWADAMERCGLTLELLQNRCDGYAMLAERLDPVKHWFYLIDQLDRRHQEDATGDALRARDLYDAAEVMRLWHAQIADAPLPRLDEPRTAFNTVQAKINLFGTRDIHRNRQALSAVLEHYGLYPWRVQLVVEGSSDAAALRTLLSEMWNLTFEGLGIHVVNMRGAKMPKNADQLLAEMRGYANYYLLVFDNEGNAPELVRALVKRGVIEGVSDTQVKEAIEEAAERARQRGGDDPAARRQALKEEVERAKRLDEKPGEAPEFFIWREDMEADNFECDEICEIVESHARETIAAFSLPRDEIRATVEAEAQRTEGKGVAEIVLASAASHDPPLTLESGKDTLAELLMKHAIGHPKLRGEDRPILVLAEHLVRLAGAHRRLRGKLRS